MSVAHFLFHGVAVSIDSPSLGLTSRLERDFEYFRVEQAQAPEIAVHARLAPPPWNKIPRSARGIRTRNATVYNDRGVRCCAYGREALAIIDFRKNFGNPCQVEIFSDDLNRLHEVTYLLVLSRVGKILDQRGLHRLHAMGVASGGAAILLTAPMGGGKSTLFLELLKEPGFEIISDDSPLISREGDILTFPLRVGLKRETEERLRKSRDFDLSQSYEIERMHYGRKTLLPISALKRAVCPQTRFERILLLTATRTDAEPRIRRVRGPQMALPLIKSLIIGEGLPIMREYFIEGSGKDTLDLARISRSRTKAALALARRAELYEVALGPVHERNAGLIRALLKNPAMKPAPYTQGISAW